MHTLFDFISSVNAVQYGLALLFAFGFIIFNEVLKHRPFEGLVSAVIEDVRHIRTEGKMMVLARKMALGPVYLVVYLSALPLMFLQGLAVVSGRGIASMTSAGWSPVRAYFTGRKKSIKNRQRGSE